MNYRTPHVGSTITLTGFSLPSDIDGVTIGSVVAVDARTGEATIDLETASRAAERMTAEAARREP
jgi:hypothetical protein